MFAGGGHDGEHPSYSGQQQFAGQEKVSNPCKRIGRNVSPALAMLIKILFTSETCQKSACRCTMISRRLMQMKSSALQISVFLTADAIATSRNRWNDDVVFKGQARTEPETKKRFVNDTIRNDFHRRFLTKYIK